MISFKSAFISILAAAGASAHPPVLRDETGLESRAITPNSQGTSNGFFYQFCKSHDLLNISVTFHWYRWLIAIARRV
jgi:hypothetical protein